MASAILSGALGLLDGVSHLGLGQVVMMAIAGVLLYLGIRKGFEPLFAGAHRVRRHPREHPPGRSHGRGGDAQVLLRLRHPHRDLPGADLPRHRRHDRLRAAVLQPQDHHAGGGRAVRHFFDTAAGAGPGLRQAGRRGHRRHRRLRRAHRHLRQLALRASPAGGGVGGGLLLYVAGAADPAADHARADHRP